MISTDWTVLCWNVIFRHLVYWCIQYNAGRMPFPSGFLLCASCTVCCSVVLEYWRQKSFPPFSMIRFSFTQRSLFFTPLSCFHARSLTFCSCTGVSVCRCPVRALFFSSFIYCRMYIDDPSESSQPNIKAKQEDTLLCTERKIILATQAQQEICHTKRKPIFLKQNIHNERRKNKWYRDISIWSSSGVCTWIYVGLHLGANYEAVECRCFHSLFLFNWMIHLFLSMFMILAVVGDFCQYFA